MCKVPTVTGKGGAATEVFSVAVFFPPLPAYTWELSTLKSDWQDIDFNLYSLNNEEIEKVACSLVCGWY